MRWVFLFFSNSALELRSLCLEQKAERVWLGGEDESAGFAITYLHLTHAPNKTQTQPKLSSLPAIEKKEKRKGNRPHLKEAFFQRFLSTTPPSPPLLILPSFSLSLGVSTFGSLISHIYPSQDICLQTAQNITPVIAAPSQLFLFLHVRRSSIARERRLKAPVVATSLTRAWWPR